MNTYLVLADGTVRDLGPVAQPVEGKTQPPPPKYFGCKPFAQEAPPTEEQIAAAVRSLQCPKSLPSWRVRAILAIEGKLAAAEAFIDALPEPQRTVTKYAWENNEQVERHGVLLASALPVLGITDEAADEMFIAGAGLTPN